MDIRNGRPATLAPNGMVCSPHALASAAGSDVLRAGGSAVDAAIATSAALAVIYPHMTSIGGDAFWLIYDAAVGSVRYVNGGGRAVAGATLDALAERGLHEIPYRGIVPATLTVPGAVASWCLAHEAYGKLPLGRNLEAAMGYARDGFPVTARLAGWIAQTQTELSAHPEVASIFMPDSRAPSPGTKLTNPGLARALASVADGGRAGFYEGDTAEEMARFSREHGGFFTADDLRAQTARWGEPVSTCYRDVVIYQTPPPTQGLSVLQMFNLLRPLNLAEKPFLGPDAVHMMVQAKQIAYRDRDHWLADPDFTNVPTEYLLSAEYADERRRLMNPMKALPWDEVPSEGSLKGDTVYVAAVDAKGNAASLIQSLYWAFGSAVVAGRTGIVLQNRSAYFSLDPRHPNRLEPGKIPLHTLIASLGFRDDRLWSVLGCMGADGQPQIQLQVYSALIDHGLDIQDAIEAPRWLSGRFVLGESRDTLHMEGRFAAETLNELARRGHPVNRWPNWNELAGHAHGILIDPKSGVLMGGSDPRSDGAAVGF